MSPRITTLEQLAEAAQNKRSVHCPDARFSPKPRPAAFMINLSGHILCRLFKDGMFIYEKPASK
ncbi:hypothetical protein WJU23_05350 [Prosthecobacter sp. SYSU 5D2]|uniref:hypothetical protein n=1 Tax=Prosthecobacter sp. SYSU 5D2 TaxID=3134134 RepID=UPI0031FE95F1